jgi:RHS repeat-associated protein
VSLDAAGNITYKSDVGTYTYDGTRRHLVSSTTNGWSFSYDANGNLQSGRGQSITWTSYNLPASITAGATSSQFSYTPDRQYWKQVAQYSNGPETTIYVGGLLEKVSGSTFTEYRHMIYAGSAKVLVTRSTATNNNTYYLTTDHLNSNNLVMDAAGTAFVRESYDAYGKRRGTNWTGSPTSGDLTNIANTTRRGFTGHTMLDNLGLIHMNGRVYDQNVGCFLSYDPVIESLGETQSLNPYSYVMNNPLTYVDPSGYSFDIWTVVNWIATALLCDVPYIGPFLAAAWNAGVSYVETGRFSYTVPIPIGGSTSVGVGGGSSGMGSGGDWGSGVRHDTWLPDFGVKTAGTFGSTVALPGSGGGLYRTQTTAIPVLYEAPAGVLINPADPWMQWPRWLTTSFYRPLLSAAAATAESVAAAVGVSGLAFATLLIVTPSNGLSTECRWGELNNPCAPASMPTEKSDADGGTPTQDKVTKRPSRVRKGTEQQNWDDAEDGPTGGKLCPDCHEEVHSQPGETFKDWDNDHNPAWRDRDLRGKTRKEVLDEYNRKTRLRCIPCNRGDNGSGSE